MKNWLRNQLGDWLLRGDDPPATRPIEVDSLDDAAIASRSLANDVHHRNEYATQLLKRGTALCDVADADGADLAVGAVGLGGHAAGGGEVLRHEDIGDASSEP